MEKFMSIVRIGKKSVQSFKDACLKASLALIGGFSLGAVPAHANFDTDMTALQTQATTTLGSISSSQVAVMGVVFGLIALAIGFGWIVKTGKKA